MEYSVRGRKDVIVEILTALLKSGVHLERERVLVILAAFAADFLADGDVRGWVLALARSSEAGGGESEDKGSSERLHVDGLDSGVGDA